MIGLMLEISVTAIALAFAVLTGVLAVTLREARRSMDQVRETLVRLEQHMNELSHESGKLIRNTNQLAEDVNRKLRSLDKLFQSAHRMGDAVHEAASSVKQISAAFSNSFVPRIEQTFREPNPQVSDVMQWISMTLELVQKCKKPRKNGPPRENTM